MVLLTLTSGCGVSHSAVGKKQKTHGTIVVALSPLTNINWLFPLHPIQYNSVVDGQASNLLFKNLFHTSVDGKINYHRSIARSIHWNKQGTVFTIRLNPKWHWSNGTPVTAKDVQFTWQLLKSSSARWAPAPWPFAGANSGGVPNLIHSFIVLSKYSFAIHLNTSVNQQWFLYNGLIDFIPLPHKVWDKYPNNMKKELQFIGKHGDKPSFFQVTDGPFRLKSAVQNSAWTFIPNPAYNGHKAKISRLIFSYQTSDTAEFNALKTGVVQVGYLPASMYQSAKQLSQNHLLPTYTPSIDRIILNFKNPKVGQILRTLAVRQAMQYGIDQTAIIHSLYHGLGEYGTNPVPLRSTQFINPKLNKPIFAFNIQKGIAVLHKAGFHRVHGIMQNKQGQKLSFSMQFIPGNTTVSAMVQLIQQDWAKEGIQVSLVPTPGPQKMADHKHPNKWQIQAGDTWLYGEAYPTGGGLFATHGGFNFFGYSNPTMNKLVVATHRPYANSTQSKAAMFAYETFAAHHLPVLFLPMEAGLKEYATKVHGVRKYQNDFTGLISPQYWSIS